MKVIILAGGLGTRLSEETSSRSKPMVEIGRMPMLWRVMNIYVKHGYSDFMIACGYKGEVIKEYFRNFIAHNSDLFINLRDGFRGSAAHSHLPWVGDLLCYFASHSWISRRTFISGEELAPWLRDYYRSDSRLSQPQRAFFRNHRRVPGANLSSGKTPATHHGRTRGQRCPKDFEAGGPVPLCRWTSNGKLGLVGHLVRIPQRNSSQSRIRPTSPV